MTTTDKYIYVDSDNTPLFTKERYRKKDGSKGYAYSHVVNGITIKTMPEYPNGTPLYNLHRLAKYPKHPVYLVEGEKCVDALTKLKILATTSGGASSEDRANWQPLAGREVIAWADNDDAGLGYIQRATEKLSALNATVKQIDIDALHLVAKGDCVDWLAKFEAEQCRPATNADIETLPLKSEERSEPKSDDIQASNASTLPQTDDQVIAYLATLSKIEYDRVRKDQAKALSIQIKTLDMIVKAERERINQADSPFTEIEPWHEPINPAQLLDEITRTIQRFIVLDKHQAQVATLWICACWFIDVIDCAPIALINAPERAVGITLFLLILET